MRKNYVQKRKPTTEELLEIIRNLPDRSEEELDEWENEVRKRRGLRPIRRKKSKK